MIFFAQESKDLIEPLLGALSTLVAAFLGAWFAFGLENQRRNKERRESHVVSANLASFSFIRAHNTFLNIKSQIISGFEDHPARHHFIKPMLWDSLHKIQIDFPSLSFLLSIDPNVLGEIAIIEQDVNGTIDIIRDRSKLHHDQLQPVVEQLQRSGRNSISTEEVDAELGPRSAEQLRIATDYMIAGVDRAIESTKRAASAIRDVARKEYPGQKFIFVSE